MSASTIEALERALAGDRDADDALRSAVGVLAEYAGVAWAGIAFVEEGGLVLGPSAGVEDEAHRQRVPISFQGATVGELWVDGTADEAFLREAADRLSAHVLIGWDTQGEAWEP